MPHQPDYSVFDRPEILQVVFYPKQDWTPPPAGARDYLIDVEAGTQVSCRFYPADAGSPCILYFDGNGEVACEHDSIAPLYNRLGISLFVADYRGYGRSNGTPNFTSMTTDAHTIFRFFSETVRSSSDRLFVMGRSLGSHAALELASQRPDLISGLIVESGASGVARMASRFGGSPERIDKLADALSARVRAIELPALIIHGELDSLIPVSAGIELHQEIGSEDKQLVIIPGAEHNDICSWGRNITSQRSRTSFFRTEDFVFPNDG